MVVINSAAQLNSIDISIALGLGDCLTPAECIQWAAETAAEMAELQAIIADKSGTSIEQRVNARMDLYLLRDQAQTASQYAATVRAAIVDSSIFA